MKRSRIFLFLAVSLTLASGIALRAQDNDHGSVDEQRTKLVGSIPVPGKPFASVDIVWADQATGIVVFGDRSNLGVDVINGRTDLFVGRATTNTAATIASTTVPSAATGTVHFGGVTSPTTHEGPNGVVTTTDKKVWAGDGDSTVKVVDVDPASPTYLSIIAVISTATPGCTGGPAGTCNRADELAFDPDDNIIAVANDEPTGIPPYLTFIRAEPPYKVLGQLNFSVQGDVAGNGLEQPAWDHEIHRFLQTLPNTRADGSGSIVEIKLGGNPFAAVSRTISLAGFHCSPTGEALAPNGRLVVACGNTGGGNPFPLILQESTGTEVGPGVTGIGNGDEVNYSPGENEFIVSSTYKGITGNPDVLGVISAETGELINTAPPATSAPNAATLGTGGLLTTGRAGNPASVGKRIFVAVRPAAAPATDICGTFSGVDQGCVAVFDPFGPGDNDHNRRDDDDRGKGDDDGGFGGFHFDN